jgi:type IV pilus assembly protein PilY1
MNHQRFRAYLGSILLGLMLWPGLGQALNIANTPLFLTGSAQPLVMLDISKDQQLYKKAYNDYSDLDGDGQLDTTYKDSISYYGYFDPYKCYSYDTTNLRFAPQSIISSTTNHYCPTSTYWSGNFLNWSTMTRMDAVRKLLYGGKRSTDTADSTVLERVYLPTDAHSFAKYYNGSDIAQLTPYNPPIAPTAINTSDSNNSAGVGTGLKIFRVGSNTTSFSVGDQVVIKDHSTPANYMVGAVSCVNGSGISMYNSIANSADSCSSNNNEIAVVVESTGGSTGGSNKNWDIYNWTQTGITICNTTLGGDSPQNVSQTNTNPPLMRVAQGNFALWGANERWQCIWRDETNFSGLAGEDTSRLAGAVRTNGNRAALTGIYASSIGPNKTTSSAGRIANGLGSYDYTVRIRACVNGLVGTERCKQYDVNDINNLKPIGLLQVYGDTDQIRFGLMTGSYANNTNGGVLRKNVGTFTNEVNASNGNFVSTGYSTATSAATPGIINTLDRMRLYGYSYSDGGIYNNNDNCPWQITSFSAGSCSTWGNPMSEIYYESLRYFANHGSTPYSPLYNYTSAGSKDATLGLPEASWTQPVTQTNYCAPLNALVFNASVSSYDFDLAGTDMSSINASGTAAGLAAAIDTGESISSHNHFIGSNGSNTDELCDAKSVSSLGSIYGICPEGPTINGSYLMPGLAYQAHTHKIRTDLTVPSTDTKSLKVTTYGVQLATNVPQVNVALSGSSQILFTIQPAYRLFNSAPQGGGALVDMKIVNQVATSTTASGLIYLNWEDSEQGGDYDQDVWGVLSYCYSTQSGNCGSGSAANKVYITTNVVAYSTVSPQGFGYIISGTTQDGPHFHAGILGYNFTDPTNITVTGGSGHISASGGCNNCQYDDVASTATYTLGTNSATSLQDPLWYAAKWGGFSDTNGNGTLTSTAQWDSLTNATGNGCATPPCDGIPDNYFFVSNPLGLETALNNAFIKILKDSSASAVATNSSTLNTGSRIYQGRFSSSFWSGQLLSYRLDPATGAVISAATAPPNWDLAATPYPEWDAGQQIRSQASASSDSRVILTRGSAGTGVDFQYTNLVSSQQTALNRDRYSHQDNCGSERVAYLRGWSVNEGTGDLTCAAAPNFGVSTPQKFRARSVSILGDIIDSNPAYMGAPSAGYSDADHPGYSAFRASYLNRTPVVFVGGNDGMLHGFDVSVTSSTNTPTTNAGKEMLAYVPAPVYGNLGLLTDQNYSANHHYFVNGSPMVADVCVSTTATCSNAWQTMLVGGLGAGGNGFYALNVTDPAHFDTTHATNIVQWEFTNADDADLGLTYNLSPNSRSTGQSKQMVQFQNGRWGVVVGNGYNSTNGKAVLYVLFASGPTGGTSPHTWQSAGVDYVKIVADAPVGLDNGLSNPVPFDSNGDGLMDTVYAGDLKGNLWKFDLSNADPTHWGVAYSGTALFSAGTSQPITTPPEVTLHPSGGMMVLFGTGQYLTTADATSTTQQTFYGIRDNGAVVTGTSNLTPVLVSTTDITATAPGGTATTTTYRTTALNCGASPLVACPTTPAGWYVNLPTSGERTTGSPQLVSGTVFFNTFIPSVSPCDFGGSGWLMALNYLTGLTPSSATFDTNLSGNVGSGDTPVAGMQIGAALGGTTLISSSASGGVSVGVSSLTTGNTTSQVLNLGAGSRGRINWREILQ